MSGQTMARVLAPLARGVRNMIARAVVRLVDDGPRMQTLQVAVTAGETLDAVEHWHPYGFASHPQAGAEALLVCLAGSRAKPVVVACADRRYRLTGLSAGEVAIHDDQGQSIILGRDGIRVTAPTVSITGAVTITGACTVTGLLTAQGGLAMSGGTGGASASVTGDLAVSGAVSAASVSAPAVTAAGIGLSTHHHPGTTGPLA